MAGRRCGSATCGPPPPFELTGPAPAADRLMVASCRTTSTARIPGCSHVFPAAAVAGVAALVCPQCGGVFQVKVKQTVPPPGHRILVEPLRTRPRRSIGFLVWLVVGVLVFVSLGLMTAVIYRSRGRRSPTGPVPYRSIEHNYSVLPPGPPWQQDVDLAERLGGVLAFRRDDPEARVVLAVREYPKYVPTAGELRDEAVAPIAEVPVREPAARGQIRRGDICRQAGRSNRVSRDH